jgi:MFS family permease
MGLSKPDNGKASSNSVPLLLLLSGVYGLQALDQNLMGLFAQAIKIDLRLSDTQVGLLTGAAFSLFYVVLGFPLARLADRHNRKLIVIVSVLLFSAATATCGMAAGFASLFITRICVAVGEAGTMPSAVSMLADRFKPSTRRLAMTIHSSGGYLGNALGILALSTLSANVHWRTIFWGAGAVGLLLALAFTVLVREPPRETRPVNASGFVGDMGALARNAPYVLITLGLGAASIASAAANAWVPAFLARSHGLPQSEILLFLGLSGCFGATLGSITSGFVTNRLNRKGGHWPLLLLSVLALAFPLILLLAFSTSVLSLSLAGIVAGGFLSSGLRGPAFATIQDIVPNNLQATANAPVMFSMYAFGVTIGPLATGMISDALKPYAGADALRYALCIMMVIGGIAAAGLFAFAALNLKTRTVRAERSVLDGLHASGRDGR